VCRIRIRSDPEFYAVSRSVIWTSLLNDLKKFFLVFWKIVFDPDSEMDPDPELPEKSDLNPEIIFSDPTHCHLGIDLAQYENSFHIMDPNLI